MNKSSFFLIPAIVALTAFGGWRILRHSPAPATQPDAHAHSDEHEHEHEHEHGQDHDDGPARVELDAEARKNATLEVAEAGPAVIPLALPLYGKATINEETLCHVVPRFPGIVKAVRKRLGDRVEKGETLATVESNESLRSYPVASELSGTVIGRDVTLGEFVKDDKPIFTVADLSSVWIDLTVFRGDFARLKVGQAVAVDPGNGAEALPGEIRYISPLSAEETQAAFARVLLPNPGGVIRPGLFVNARVTTGTVAAAVAVKPSAIQTLGGEAVVFVEEGDAFEARAVRLGAKSEEWVEVLSGLRAGEKYAAGNSFILKAHLGKEEAEHEH